MGKSGGFFKRLKAKQKRAASRASRGTTGRSKEARRLHKDAMARIYAERRKIEQMEAISSSDSELDAEETSSDSDFGGAAKKGRIVESGGRLDELRGLLGVQARLPDEEEETDTLSGADEREDEEMIEEEGSAEVDESDEAEEADAEEDEEGRDPEEGDDVDYVALFSQVEGGAEIAASGLPGREGKARDRGKKRSREDEALDSAEEEEEAEESDNEEVYLSPDDPQQREKTRAEGETAVQALLPPAFTQTAAARRKIGAVDAAALGSDVVRCDPWYRRFHKAEGADDSTEISEGKSKRAGQGSKGCHCAADYLLSEQALPLEANASTADSTRSEHGEELRLAIAETVPAKTVVDALLGASTRTEGHDAAVTEGIRPPFIHNVIWEHWCTYRAKLVAHIAIAATARLDQRINAVISAPGEGPVTEEEVAAERLRIGKLWELAASPEAAGALRPDEARYWALLQSYTDVLDTTHCWENREVRRSLLALHLLNHWCKSRAIVAAHDALLAERAKQRGETTETMDDDIDEDEGEEGLEFRDQGFGRTRLLVMLPLRNVALELVETLMRILLAREGGPVPRPPGDTDEEAARGDDVSILEMQAAVMGTKTNGPWLREEDPYRIYTGEDKLPFHAQRARYFVNSVHAKNLDRLRGDFSENEYDLNLRAFRRRPEEYRRSFYGSIDDTFCFGISLGLPNSTASDGKKKKRKNAQPACTIYSHVLNSDIIICSPLGLRRRIRKAGDVLVALSSIEVCAVEGTDMFLMQNWDHLREVIELLGVPPKDTTEGLNRISRLYRWLITPPITGSLTVATAPGAMLRKATVGAVARRQNIIMGNGQHATLMATFRRMQSLHLNGTVSRARDEDEPPLGPGIIHPSTIIYKKQAALITIAAEAGVIQRVSVPVRQHYIRFNATSVATSDDERFDYFTNVLFPTRIRHLIDRDVRTILFVPSYFDFVRLRTWLRKDYRDETAFLSETCTESEQRQVLGQFTDLERPLLVISERFYYFRRYFVKHAEVLVFYSPPVTPFFYPAIVSKINADSPNASVMVLFGRYDAHELRRIAGAGRSRALLTNEATAYSFITYGKAKSP